ncbi:MAG TPA: nitronate monooxygenase [Rhizobiaceae bacterium]|nr:nitronate monooxygenase [Rhizobiaceae bacterium]
MPTEFCRQLGIRAPIIQAPMNWATDARLVAAVSEAGGMGTIGPNAGREAVAPSPDPAVTGERLRREIHEVRRLTAKPFAVNFPIGHGAARAFSDRAVAVAIEEGISVAIVVMGSPEVYTEKLKKAGVFVIHAVGSAKHARKAEEHGCDAVVAEGFEAGGHSGFDELPMNVLVPQVVEAVSIPVIAAGGIVDGRGLLAALSAGAGAAYMGTRFMATTESPIHEAVKQAIVGAEDTSTASWGRRIGVARTLRNAFTIRFREMELAGASADELRALIADYDLPGGRRVGGLRAGDLDQGEVYMGAGAGMIRDVLTCAEVIERTLAQAREIHEKIGRALARPGTRPALGDAA